MQSHQLKIASLPFYTKTARDTPKKDGIASSFAMFLH